MKIRLTPDPWADTSTLAEVDKDTGRLVPQVNLSTLCRIRYWATRVTRTPHTPVEQASVWLDLEDKSGQKS